MGFWLYSKTIVQRWQIVSKFKQSSVCGFATKVYNSMLCYALYELRQSCLTSQSYSMIGQLQITLTLIIETINLNYGIIVDYDVGKRYES